MTTATPPPALQGHPTMIGGDLDAAAYLANDLLGLGLPLPEEVAHHWRAAAHVSTWRRDQTHEALQTFQGQWIADAIAAAEQLGELPDVEPLAHRIAIGTAQRDVKTVLDKVMGSVFAAAKTAAGAHRADMLTTLIGEYGAVVAAFDQAMAELPAGVDTAEQAIPAGVGQQWQHATDLASRWWRLRSARTELARRSGHDEQLASLKYPQRLDAKALPGRTASARRAHAILHSEAQAWCPTDQELLEHMRETTTLSKQQHKQLAALDARTRA